jgi:hypothetical protein
MARRRGKVAQAWIELATGDPEALSALAVARSHLEAGRDLESLRRVRLFELAGSLPGRAEVDELLHRSIQFYNPRKERCTLRANEKDPAPVGPHERVVLVFDRGGERRPAAERWWRHETGGTIEVREGVAWVLGFAPGTRTDATVEDLALVRGRRHGLLCNPHAQECRIVGERIPLPWIDAERSRRDAAAPSRGG